MTESMSSTHFPAGNNDRRDTNPAMDSRRTLLAAIAFAAALVVAGCQTTGSGASAPRPAASGPMVGVGY